MKIDRRSTLRSTWTGTSAVLTAACGGWLVFCALWNPSDIFFGSGSYSAFLAYRFLIDPVSHWLFDKVGHWGPRIVLCAIGVQLVAASFWLVSLAEERASADERPARTKTFAVLSWTLVLLVLSLVAFIVAGPYLHDPAIDSVLSYWSEWYYVPTALFAAALFLSAPALSDWREFRETGDPWALFRPLFYLAIAIAVVIFLVWNAFTRPAGGIV